MIDFLRNLRWYLRSIFHYRNCFKIARQIVNKISVQELTLKNGISFFAPADSNLHVLVEEIFFTQDYCKYFTINKNDVVLDIGANIGVFTIFASTMTKNKIYAFEALRSNVDFLNKNISANKVKNVVVTETAVCGQSGNARLGLARISGGHYLCDVNTKKDSKNFVTVPATTLEQIFTDYRIEHIDFLKMDCEGSEGAIITATHDEYFKRIGKIAMEFHDTISLLNRYELDKHFKRCGFRTRMRSFRNTCCGYLYAWR
jgi:FkbM family methyltransferase